MLAPAAVAAGTAQLSGTVHRAEGRCGQGDEEPGMVAYRVGDVLAAEETRADEVVGVSGVETGAGRADGCAPVAAAHQEAFAGFGAGVVVAEDLAGCCVESGGGAGEMDRVGAAAGCGDLFQQASDARILGEADGIAVCFGELTQARRTVEDGAPVSRGGLRGDGGDLPGWTAEAARWMSGGALSVMGITPWCAGGGVGSADGAGAPADAAAPHPSGPGLAGSVALAVGAPHAAHGHGRVLPAQVWEKPLITQVTRPWMVNSTGVWPR